MLPVVTYESSLPLITGSHPARSAELTRYLGFILVLGSFVIAPAVMAVATLYSLHWPTSGIHPASIAMCASAVVFLAGSAAWAVGKGYRTIVGILLGTLGPIGLLGLTMMPDRCRRRPDWPVTAFTDSPETVTSRRHHSRKV